MKTHTKFLSATLVYATGLMLPYAAFAGLTAQDMGIIEKRLQANTKTLEKIPENHRKILSGAALNMLKTAENWKNIKPGRDTQDTTKAAKKRCPNLSGDKLSRSLASMILAQIWLIPALQGLPKTKPQHPGAVIRYL